MSLNANRARLSAITKNLLLQWGETRNYWRDARGGEFGKKYIEPLAQEMEKASVICEKLDKIIAKARNDCE